MVEGQLISVAAEEDIVATLTTFNSYIDVNENTIECLFQSLEVVNAIFVKKGKKIPTPHLSKVIKMGIKQIIERSTSWIWARKISAWNTQSCASNLKI